MSQFLEFVDNKASEHRSLPFWSLNDKLEPEEMRAQVRAMHDAGIGGFFMHARGGLETEYMGEEWMECIKASIDEADKLGMHAWAYDENGWPSGYADGAVPAKGWEYWQKCLDFAFCEADPNFVKKANDEEVFAPERVLGYYRLEETAYTRLDKPEAGACCVYIRSNQYYIDILSDEVIQYFLEVTHDRYYKESAKDAGKSWKGFFTDEPQYGHFDMPWSTNFEKIFSEKYGYDLLNDLPALLLPFDGHEKVRNDYWALVAEKFTHAFGKQIHDWCQAHDLQLTGHMMAEDSLSAQLGCTSGVMQFYPYFDMPGMDWLSRGISSPVQPKQVSSVSEQLGRRAITETFALCGWDVSWEELKWVAEWQYVNGINVTCQHLAPYSLRGLRKRDYPPAFSFQQSWFPVFDRFNDYFARLGALVSAGRAGVDVLMLHPIRSMYLKYDTTRKVASEMDWVFVRETELLSDNHVDYHYADEMVMQEYAKVEGDEFVIGKCRYKAFVLPSCCNMMESTYALLETFVKNGGKLYALGELPTMIDGVYDERLVKLVEKAVMLHCGNCVRRELGVYDNIDLTEDGKQCGAIHYCKRYLDDGSIACFMVNHDTDIAHTCKLQLGEGTVWLEDLVDLKEEPMYPNADGSYTLEFAPRQSYVIRICPPPVIETLALADNFTIESRTLNAQTLDFCDYRIDGGEWVENMAIIILQRKLLEMKRPCHVDLRMHFTVEAEHMTEMYACIEVPEKFAMTLNGQPLEATDCGYYIDKAFRKINILPYIRQGENTLELSCEFWQRDKVYHVLYDKGVYESELNKLTYDTELESIYLLGDFDVYSTAPYTYGERKATFTDGPFVIRDMGTTLKRGDFGEQGFRFFSGILKVAQPLFVRKEAGKRYVLKLEKPWAPVAKLYINDREVKLLTWQRFDTDITEYLVDGENKLAIELFASNRNLLGPHHYFAGESYAVGPNTFTDVGGWSDPPGVEIWRDRYCFVRFGVQ